MVTRPGPGPERPPSAADPDELVTHVHRLDPAALQAGSRFVRDSRVGGMFHRRQVSLRERAARGSLHVSLGEGNRVSVHVDRWSPLGQHGPESRSRYSLVRVIGHNVGIVMDAALLVVRRRWGHQRCELECETVCSDVHPEGPGSTPPA